MRLVTFEADGVTHFGRVVDDKIVPMGADLVGYLQHGNADDGDAVRAADVHLLAPIPKPGKILAVGPNYADHAKEAQQSVPPDADHLIVMAKFANSIIGPDEAIEIPPATQQVDYEAELGVVIGTRARDVSPERALEHVAGYLCTNDVSARDLQFGLSGLAGLIRGKAIDTFFPIGPWLVTADEVGDPHDLRLRCVVNGEPLQETSTGEMLFSVPEIVSTLSRTITLEPGDIIATGSPPGVGFGRNPQRFLKEGDEVVVEIEKLGSLRNPVRQRR